MDTKTRPIYMLSIQDTYRLKMRGWKNIYHANWKQKKAGVALLTSDKTDLKIKNIKISMGKATRNIQGKPHNLFRPERNGRICLKY